MTLHDDFHGKDFEEFRNVLKKVDSSNGRFKHIEWANVLNIERLESENGQLDLSLNNYVLDKEQDLPLFTYLAKLTKKIANMDDGKFVVNGDYKEEFAQDILISGYHIEEYNKIPQDKKELFFNVSYVKRIAQEVNNYIQNLMYQHFR